LSAGLPNGNAPAAFLLEATLRSLGVSPGGTLQMDGKAGNTEELSAFVSAARRSANASPALPLTAQRADAHRARPAHARQVQQLLSQMVRSCPPRFCAALGC
jgi:hypothetical protein